MRVYIHQYLKMGKEIKNSARKNLFRHIKNNENNSNIISQAVVEAQDNPGRQMDFVVPKKEINMIEKSHIDTTLCTGSVSRDILIILLALQMGGSRSCLQKAHSVDSITKINARHHSLSTFDHPNPTTYLQHVQSRCPDTTNCSCY